MRRILASMSFVTAVRTAYRKVLGSPRDLKTSTTRAVREKGYGVSGSRTMNVEREFKKPKL